MGAEHATRAAAASAPRSQRVLTFSPTLTVYYLPYGWLSLKYFKHENKGSERRQPAALRKKTRARSLLTSHPSLNRRDGLMKPHPRLNSSSVSSNITVNRCINKTAAMRRLSWLLPSSFCPHETKKTRKIVRRAFRCPSDFIFWKT